jgi:cation:H+ antiporter
MATIVSLPLFVVSLAVTLGAAATFARRLDRLGARFGLPEVLIGLLTAVAADGPEVSSALVALFKGANAAGVGVIVGSNVFNLAAMIGVSALLVGRVRAPLQTVLLEGIVGLAITATVIALLLGWLPAVAAVVVIACVLTPYIALVLAGRGLAVGLRLGRWADRVIASVADERERGEAIHSGVHFATHRQVVLMALDLVLIVAGSVGMVQAALALGDRWGIRPALVGVLVLGPLTSLPNALTGVRLGLANRGAALVTEALNSNTINLVAGIAVPSLFVTLAARSTADRVDLALLAATTLATVALLAPRGGVSRLGAAIIVGLYAAFVVVELL